ncbi:reticulon-1-A-like isoform X2 [Megalops cyprinoides]|uniref:reticulon-1-A-like isoform X2 n=1 Tax=Megalops cyprinoides TaxID=118141 RepID=UPI001864EFE2|nr:reticulon-1-A-like isoform X2 [Megalops cyprinoides]
MEEHVSSTTTDTGDEVAKLQTELGVENAPELDATGVQEDREAVPKSVVDENDILDLVGGALDAVGSHNAEDPHSEMQSSSSGPEPEPATELKAAEPIDSAATLESTEEHTDATEISETAPEPAKEETIPQPEAADTTVQPESDEKIVKPEAPASLAEESPSPASPLSLVDLLYWRDIKTTGVVFGASLFLLLSLTVCSIVSVCSYVALALLSVTITFRIYKGILQAVQKSDEGHPFKVYLDRDVALSEDMVHKYSDVALERLNVGIKELRRLFLVEDLVDSLKFAVVMWILTYVGALFNGLTLLILALVGVFSCPVIYEKNQTQIDHYVALVKNQIKDVVGKIQAKVPGMKRKAD